MGLCGVGGEDDGRLSSFRDIVSICIRIPKEAKGCADKLYDELYGQGLCNAIIIAPKTTKGERRRRRSVRFMPFCT